MVQALRRICLLLITISSTNAFSSLSIGAGLGGTALRRTYQPGPPSLFLRGGAAKGRGNEMIGSGNISTLSSSSGRHGMETKEKLELLVYILLWYATSASVFTLGFITLNWALGMMHVSLVMTLRATEPLFTLFLSAFLLKSETVTWKMAASLMPVILGAGLSSAESSDFRVMGLIICIVCNVMFALRGIVTKRLKAAHPVDNFNLFFQISCMGALMQGFGLLVASVFTPINLPLGKLADASYTMMLLVNGITFFAYLQLSWVVLSKVAAVTHSVCNSLRRPFICVCGWLQFGNEISLLNGIGIAMASLGTLAYAQVRISEGKSAE